MLPVSISLGIGEFTCSGGQLTCKWFSYFYHLSNSTCHYCHASLRRYMQGLSNTSSDGVFMLRLSDPHLLIPPNYTACCHLSLLSTLFLSLPTPYSYRWPSIPLPYNNVLTPFLLSLIFPTHHLHLIYIVAIFLTNFSATSSAYCRHARSYQNSRRHSRRTEGVRGSYLHLPRHFHNVVGAILFFPLGIHGLRHSHITVHERVTPFLSPTPPNEQFITRVMPTDLNSNIPQHLLFHFEHGTLTHFSVLGATANPNFLSFCHVM